jgi:hypothetical protein
MTDEEQSVCPPVAKQRWKQNKINSQSGRCLLSTPRLFVAARFQPSGQIKVQPKTMPL